MLSRVTSHTKALPAVLVGGRRGGGGALPLFPQGDAGEPVERGGGVLAVEAFQAVAAIIKVELVVAGHFQGKPM